MATLISTDVREPWVRRLYLPAYQVKDAARYANITTQTVRNWQREAREAGSAIAPRARGESLSYLQLQELAIVAAMRSIGVQLHKIRLARDWLSFRFGLEFPFSDARVKSDGQDILMEYQSELGGAASLLIANKGGQFVWKEIIGHKFAEFDYANDLAVRWNIGGTSSGVVIDPRVSFGAPSVKGVPTWAVRGRYCAGEDVDDLARDFMLSKAEVRKALKFEGVAIH